MNHGPLIFLGLFFTMAWSWYGFVFNPQISMGNSTPYTNILTQEIYPNPRPGLARDGAVVYRREGCVACHTQQVRAKDFGNDIQRGWGIRHTAAEDYLFDEPPQLGSMRIGPDLANIAARQPDENWHLLHLYNPKIKVKGSTMAPYPYLFEKRRIGRSPSPDALNIPAEFAPKGGYEVIPTDSARALVAYMLSLRADKPLFEAPMPGPKTNAPAGMASETNNAAAPATNAAANATPTAPAK